MEKMIYSFEKLISGLEKVVFASKQIKSGPKIIFFAPGTIISARKEDQFTAEDNHLAQDENDRYIKRMLHRIRLGFRNASAMTILAIGEKVLAGMSGNPSFPDPPVSMEILERALDDFSRAIQAQATGGTLATATRNNARRKVMKLLSRLALYVEDKSNNDLPTLLSSGFPARNRSRAQVPFPKAVILNITRRRSGQLNLQVRAIPNARGYQVVCTEVGPDGGLGRSPDAGVFTNSRSIPIGGLTPGKVYSFRVRAIGGSTGSGDWSDPVSHSCG